MHVCVPVKSMVIVVVVEVRTSERAWAKTLGVRLWWFDVTQVESQWRTHWISLWACLWGNCFKATAGSAIPWTGKSEWCKSRKSRAEQSKRGSTRAFVSLCSRLCRPCNQLSEAPAVFTSLLWWTLTWSHTCAKALPSFCQGILITAMARKLGQRPHKRGS